MGTWNLHGQQLSTWYTDTLEDPSPQECSGPQRASSWLEMSPSLSPFVPPAHSYQFPLCSPPIRPGVGCCLPLGEPFLCFLARTKLFLPLCQLGDHTQAKSWSSISKPSENPCHILPGSLDPLTSPAGRTGVLGLTPQKVCGSIGHPSADD